MPKKTKTKQPARCQECKSRNEELDWYKQKWICPECLNPDYQPGYLHRNASSMAAWEEEKTIERDDITWFDKNKHRFAIKNVDWRKEIAGTWEIYLATHKDKYKE